MDGGFVCSFVSRPVVLVSTLKTNLEPFEEICLDLWMNVLNKLLCFLS